MKPRTGEPGEVGVSSDRIANVKEMVSSWVGAIMPSLVVFVARRRVIVLHEAFGHLTSHPANPPLERDSLFPISSITKPITAAAAMLLVEDGLLGLNRRVSDYIPEFCGEGKDAVMVHHLLTHTSGLRAEDVAAHVEKKQGAVEVPPPEATQHPAINELLYLRYDAPLWKPAGEEMSYCNLNYDLLGEIVRRVSGRSLVDFIQERIFEPLGMNDSYFMVPDAAQRRVVVSDPAEIYPLGYARSDREPPSASMGVYSTAADVASFAQMFLDHGRCGDERILSRASVTEMTRNQIPGIGSLFLGEFRPEASWGYGWGVHGNGKWGYSPSLLSLGTFGHGGAAQTHIWGDPEKEVVLAYFSVIQEVERFWDVRRHDLFVNAVMATIDD